MRNKKYGFFSFSLNPLLYESFFIEKNGKNDSISKSFFIFACAIREESIDDNNV